MEVQNVSLREPGFVPSDQFLFFFNQRHNLHKIIALISSVHFDEL